MSETLREEIKQILIAEVASCCGCPVDPEVIDTILTAVRKRVPESMPRQKPHGRECYLYPSQNLAFNECREEMLKALE
jgi:hypothetical protein